jgi:hypothetical protein
LLVALAREGSVPRETLHYLNRLSDALFVWSRWVNHVMGANEALWQPNKAASGTVTFDEVVFSEVATKEAAVSETAASEAPANEVPASEALEDDVASNI